MLAGTGRRRLCTNARCRARRRSRCGLFHSAGRARIAGLHLRHKPVFRDPYAGAVPLLDTLSGVSVTFNNIPAPLLFVSSMQINAQLPWEVPTTGSVTVVVTNGTAASAPQTVQVGSYSPVLFIVGGYAIAVNPDGTLAAPTGAIPGVASHPATPGDSLTLWGSGFGPVSPAATSGDNSLDTLRKTTAQPTITIGGTPAQVTFAGLSPQFVGVYQINVTMPSTASPANNAPIVIQTGGVTFRGNWNRHYNFFRSSDLSILEFLPVK